ncbi:MarR family winged helix-turn-helix transcriptional regulator [Luteimicrobium sp. NPDC057192]|uniref:MarR family winged helix-turn-helix transcriptional regulator n=1 Tax=Luteimicrobium sp. NPDC057192 TaxID=3346042 RepID=UPI00363DB4C4
MTTHHGAADTPARLETRATWRVSRMHARVSHLLGVAFGAHGNGLRSYHYRLLAALEQWGDMSQADLGRRTGIDRSDVTGALGDLEPRGLVVRSPDPTHGRRKIVAITPDGVARLGELDVVIDGVQEEFLAPLTPAQRREFLDLAARLADSAPAGDA